MGAACEVLTGKALIVKAKKFSGLGGRSNYEKLWRLIEDLENAGLLANGQVEARNYHWRGEVRRLEYELRRFIGEGCDCDGK